MMAWIKQNLNAGHVLIIVITLIGWISTAAVMTFSVSAHSKVLTGVKANDISKNTDFRVQGFPFADDKSDKLDVAFNHAGDEDVHMPMVEKIKVFVPRTEVEIRLGNVESDVSDLKAGQDDIMELLLDRLPK